MKEKIILREEKEKKNFPMSEVQNSTEFQERNI